MTIRSAYVIMYAEGTVENRVHRAFNVTGSQDFCCLFVSSMSSLSFMQWLFHSLGLIFHFHGRRKTRVLLVALTHAADIVCHDTGRRFFWRRNARAHNSQTTTKRLHSTMTEYLGDRFEKICLSAICESFLPPSVQCLAYQWPLQWS